MTFSQEKIMVSNFNSNKSNYNMPFNNPFQNNLLFNSFNNDLSMFYPMYLYEVYMQMNQIAENLLSQIPKLNNLINDNSILGRKRGRSPENDEYLKNSKTLKKEELDFNLNQLGNINLGLVNNSPLSINLNVCNIGIIKFILDNLYSNLLDDLFLKIFFSSSTPNSTNTCLGHNIFKQNYDVLSRPVYQNIKN